MHELRSAFLLCLQAYQTNKIHGPYLRHSTRRIILKIDEALYCHATTIVDIFLTHTPSSVHVMAIHSQAFQNGTAQPNHDEVRKSPANQPRSSRLNCSLTVLMRPQEGHWERKAWQLVRLACQHIIGKQASRRGKCTALCIPEFQQWMSGSKKYINHAWSK